MTNHDASPSSQGNKAKREKCARTFPLVLVLGIFIFLFLLNYVSLDFICEKAWDTAVLHVCVGNTFHNFILLHLFQSSSLKGFTLYVYGAGKRTSGSKRVVSAAMTS
mmetsp:Transcript_19437/g.28141  ORF Transcript_19437/g.28141 Transcript_19437/m.28141 type:complete len:107 (-) Transcript_19437:83-403(-)